MNNDPYRPPSFESTPSPVEPPVEFLPQATRGQRFGAYIIDVLCLIVPLILFLTFSPFESINYFFESEEPRDEFIHSLLFYAFFLGINLYLIHTRSQTLGKVALGIKVTNLNCTPSSTWNQIGFRYSFFYLVTAIPVAGSWISIIDALFIFGSERRCLHDRITGTQVVKCR